MTFAAPNFVDAVYRTDEDVPALKGNPYVEALPPLLSDAELFKALTRLPAFDAAVREASAPARIQMVDEVRNIVVPLPRLVELARAVLRMLRTGYEPRSPFSKADNKAQQQLYAMQQAGGLMKLRETTQAVQLSMALVGASGCGKSFGLQTIRGLLPEAIYHPQWGKWQLPFIAVEMSYDGESIHTLAGQIFEELDRLLPDAGYVYLYMERKGMNAEQRLSKALSLAYEHGVGMLMVDEGQNQRSLGTEPVRRLRKNASSNRVPKNETPLMKLLVRASNFTHVPFLASGTLEMQAMFGARFTRARRMSGRGSAVWQPLVSSGDLKRPDEFERLLKAFWRYQWIRKPVELTDEWVQVFYRHTQGIPDMVVKLWESCQVQAIASGLETLTPAFVEQVYKREFVPASFGVTALREGDRILLDAVTDLYMPDHTEELRRVLDEAPTPKRADIRARKPGDVLEGINVGTVPRRSLPKPPKALKASPAALTAEALADSPSAALVQELMQGASVVVPDLSEQAVPL